MVGLFDNEEIGSATAMAAASNLMQVVLQRINGQASSFDSAVRFVFSSARRACR